MNNPEKKSVIFLLSSVLIVSILFLIILNTAKGDVSLEGFIVDCTDSKYYFCDNFSNDHWDVEHFSTMKGIAVDNNTEDGDNVKDNRDYPSGYPLPTEVFRTKSWWLRFYGGHSIV